MFDKINRKTAFTSVCILVILCCGAFSCMKLQDKPPSPEILGVRVLGVAVGPEADPSPDPGRDEYEFSETEALHTSVHTRSDGTPRVLKVEWIDGPGRVVADSAKTIHTAGPTVTQFMIHRPDGWPEGEYRVRVSVDGVEATTREFEID